MPVFHIFFLLNEATLFLYAVFLPSFCFALRAKQPVFQPQFPAIIGRFFFGAIGTHWGKYDLAGGDLPRRQEV